MASNTYTATLKYYDSTYGWGSEAACSQGNCTAWGGGASRLGVMYFADLSALAGKIINKVTITVTNQPSGYNASKTAYFYASAKQGGIDTSLKGSHKTGSTIFTWSATFHSNTNATNTLDVTEYLASRIANGEDTFCIYSNSSTHYLKWSKVSIVVNWSEPYSVTTGWTMTSGTVALGNTVTVTIPTLTGSNASNYHKVTYTTTGGQSGTIATSVKSGATATLTTKLAWGSGIPNDKTMTLTITVTTYTSAGTKVGANSKTKTLSMPNNDSTKPKFDFTVSVHETAGNGVFVMKHTKAKITITGITGQYGATIKSYSVSIADNWEKSGTLSASSLSLTSNTLTSSGADTLVTVSITDSRGYVRTKTTTITIWAYNLPPVITKFRAFRTTSATSTAENKKGSYLRIVIETSGVRELAGNSGFDSLKSSPTISGLPTSLLPTKTTDAVSYARNFAISDNTTYTLTYTYGDDYMRVSSKVPVAATAVPLQIAYKGMAIAIGKPVELLNHFDCGLNATFRKNIEVQGSVKAPNLFSLSDIGTKILSGEDLNNYLTPGSYYCEDSATANAISNSPVTSSGYRLIVFLGYSGRVHHMAFPGSSSIIFRTYTGSEWKDWSTLTSA